MWNCLLCFLSFLSVKHWSEGTYDRPYKNPCFPSRSVKNCTCLHLLHANVSLKTRGVEGLLPKLRAFLTNLFTCTLIIFLQSIIIKYTLYLCVVILHLKLCVFCIETMCLFRQTFSFSPIWTFAPCIGGI